MDEVIYSRDNSHAKYLHSLHDSKKASREGVVFVEGTRLCEDTLKSGVIPTIMAYTPDKKTLVQNWCELFCVDLSKVELYCFSPECFSKICSTVTPQGVALVARKPDKDANLPVRGNGQDIYVVLEDLQDPGNMGTIIRMADAFDFSAVIMNKGCVDPYSEKSMRASMGSIWHIPLVKMEDSKTIVEELRKNKITMMAMHLKGDDLMESSLSLPVAYCIGNEGNGLSAFLSESCDKIIKIPMSGKAESLNAASAASIIGYILASKRRA